jgi:uncharacterized membrane protein
MDDVVFARVLHIIAVVIWIGGVSMATTVALPAIRRGDLGADRLRAFQAIEHRFVWQARTAVIVVGLSGFYMADRLDLWDRFRSIRFWWMHAMLLVWLLFTFVLFVGEPLILRRLLRTWATKQPDSFFIWLHHAHWVLLSLSIVTIFGAAAGSHGWLIF